MGVGFAGEGLFGPPRPDLGKVFPVQRPPLKLVLGPRPGPVYRKGESEFRKKWKKLWPVAPVGFATPAPSSPQLPTVKSVTGIAPCCRAVWMRPNSFSTWAIRSLNIGLIGDGELWDNPLRACP